MAGNMTRNYQKELDEITAHLRESGKRKLLLHSCCAPCSSYCLEYLSEFFDITVFYFNPNITDKNEFDKRAAEQERLINTVNNDWREKVFESIKFVRGEYDPSRFLEISRGLEKPLKAVKGAVNVLSSDLENLRDTQGKTGLIISPPRLP